MRRILLDTSVLIAVEPATTRDVESGSPAAAELLQLMHRSGDQPLRHPASEIDLANDRDDARKTFRRLVLRKYPELTHPPEVSERLRAHVGIAPSNSHDWVDDQLLAAVDADAVSLLVTNDKGIHRKARRADLAHRVLTVEDAMEFLRRELGIAPIPPPAVQIMPAHALQTRDPIFDTLRAGYPEWDSWFTRCRQQGRTSWVIEGYDRYCAICIVKVERDQPHGLHGAMLKLCTFKVSPEFAGNGFGESLLKTAFDHVAQNRLDGCYVEVSEQQNDLMVFLEDFGFHQLQGARSRSGDVVFAKLAHPPAGAPALLPFDHHVQYGPPALIVSRGHVLVVPIRPAYHRMLFPEAESAQQLLAPQPFGNAIRKVYLSNSPLTRIERGDALLFYRSHDVHGVTSVGIVEEILRSRDPHEVSLFAGNRTVYPYSEIERMCKVRDVLAIRFRQDRLLVASIALEELVERRVLTSHPQSIARVRAEGIDWLANRIDASLS